MAAVRARGLVKRFETTCAVDGVDLVVQPGEVRGLLGPNGAGKTTLLRLLFGLVAPDAGRVELLGRPLGPPDAVRLDGVAGFVEEPAFYPYLSGRVNLELLAELDGGSEPRARVDEVLEQVGLSERAGDRVSGYSTGMRQRLGIAGALLRAPALLLLDEPTSGLDPAGVREVGALLCRLASGGTAVLLSSHLIGEIEDICDSFTVLRRGRVVWSGSAAQLRSQAPGSAYRFATSDDDRAVELATRHAGISLTRSSGGGELRLAARTGSLDPFVLELGQAGVAVRRLELLVSPLESMFFALTRDDDAGPGELPELAEEVLAGVVSATDALAGGPAFEARAARSAGGVGAVYRVERRKLASQLAVRLLALICLLGPFAFAAVLKVQSGSPADSLYGVWVHSSGFALSLVVLGFAGAWGLPLMAGVLAGDLFAAEDRHGTWKTLLTRSCTRRHVFAGKVLAVAMFALGLLALLAASSLAAGVLLVGAHPLVSLSGTVISAGHSLALVAVAWGVCALPMLAFTSLAVLFSVATRNGIVGVLGPAVVDLAMQLLALVGSGVWLHSLLAASAFDAWHPLFLSHPFYGPLAIGVLVSLIWIVACLGAAWLLLRRRDFTGAAVTRRPGWVIPVRVAVGSAALIALLAIASNWGPKGVTAARLKASITPTFNNLTLLQQRELGRAVPPGARLNVLPNCSRRGSAPAGPGDWICTLTVFIPQPGAVPFQQTPVTYDVTVQSNGCYKAESPPSFVGQQTMRDADGHQVVNPLFVIYGCLNPL